MYQMLRPLNVYLDKAKAAIADTAVCAIAKSPENHIEFNNDVGTLSVVIALLKLSKMEQLSPLLSL